MTLHVHDGPEGNTTDCGKNVWVTEVPADFTDADVQWNIEQWAAEGSATAKLALKLVRSWISFYKLSDDPTRRVYEDS